MTSAELKDKKRKHQDNDEVEKKVKKDKKEKKEKKDRKEKKEKKEKKDKKEKNHNDEPVAADTPAVVVETSSDSEIQAFLTKNEVKIENEIDSIKPIVKFSTLGQFDVTSKLIKKLSNFNEPSPIQAAAWPYLLKGHDVVGVAETGSGKTLGFGIPAIDYILKSKSKDLQVLVISPTRELATQIYDNMKDYMNSVGLDCVCIYGGVPKEQQRNDVKKSQCVIATPGRLCDLIDEGSVNLSKVKFLVLDEADRMLEKGFEEDIKKIVGSTSNSSRQTVMFTATWPKEVRELAGGYMKNPVRVSIGNRDELTANKRIKQIVEVVDNYDKEKKLIELLQKYQSGKNKNDKILIFALYKKEASRVERTLKYKGYNVAALHGDLNQTQRQHALDSFKRGDSNLMLATDVAARGLDIPNVKVVINLTFPLTIEDYVHRIGRTGRAGQSGIAHTLFTDHEKHLSGALMNVLRGADQPVPQDLLKFGSHTKKKEHSAYGAFYKNVDPEKKAKKITFD